MDILKKKMKTKDKRRNIAIAMKQAENFVLREKQAENFMTEVVSQPTTMTSKVVIINHVVQYVAVESTRAEVEDRFSAPLSLTRVSVTRDSSVTVVREQSAHHGMSSVYKDGEKRDVVTKASLVVKYIAMDVVQKRVVRKFEPAELALELDMPGEPLSHHEQRDGGQELLRQHEGGGFGRAGWHLGVFPPACEKEKYEYGQVGSKKDKLERRSLERCRRAASSNSCPGGVLEGVNSLQSSFIFVIICNSRSLVCKCPVPTFCLPT